MSMINEIAWTAYKYDFGDKLIPLEDRMLSGELSDEELDDLEEFGQPVNKIFSTAFGVFELDDQLNPFRQFEFWKGSTNFDITEKVVEYLNSCPGVETLTIVSRYTFIIGIGKMFDFRSVRLDIEGNLCGKHSNEHVLSKIKNEEFSLEVHKLLDILRETKDKYWCAYIFPNGQMTKFSSNNEEEFEIKMKKYGQAKTISKGLLLSSKNENKKSSFANENSS